MRKAAIVALNQDDNAERVVCNRMTMRTATDHARILKNAPGHQEAITASVNLQKPIYICLQ